MKKTIIKTAITTFVLAILFIAIVFGGIAIFAPKKLANTFDKLGNYKWATYFYESQYNKTQDYKDLGILCTKVDEENDTDRAYKYLKFFCDSSHEQLFNEFCNNNQDIMGITSEEFFFDKYVTAAFYSKGEDVANLIVDEYLIRYGETAYGPDQILPILKNK